MEIVLNERLKKIREHYGLTQIEMADKLKVTQGTVSDIERGRIGVSNKFAGKVFAAFDVNKNWFYTGDGNMENKGKNFNSDAGKGLPIDHTNAGRLLKKKIELDIKNNHKELYQLFTALDSLEYLSEILNNFIPTIAIQGHEKWDEKYNNSPLKMSYNRFKNQILTHLQYVSHNSDDIVKFRKQLVEFLHKMKPLDRDGEIILDNE